MDLEEQEYLAISFEDSPDRSWVKKANCLGLDPDLFFQRGTISNEVKSVCASCIVREDCLEYALETKEKYGIWGGVSDRGRQAIRRKRLRESKQQQVQL